jgi:hypothetical protein
VRQPDNNPHFAELLFAQTWVILAVLSERM